VDLSGYRAGEAGEELDRLEYAVGRARRELTDLVVQTSAQVGEAEAAIFEAHLGLLDDPALQDPVRSAVAAGRPAPQAWQDRVEALRADFARLTDEYQRERAQDVSSVGDRVLRALAGGDEPRNGGQGDEPVVLVVDELDPATAATLDPGSVAGVVTVRGGATGHGVLVARARGVAVLTGAAAAAGVPAGTTIAFDARTGLLTIDPDDPARAAFGALLESRAAERRRLQDHARGPARTSDGHVVRVKANLAGIGEAAEAVAAGAEGSGLVRTEVLFGDRQTAPAVGEQVGAIEAIAEAMQGRPITVRTWDVGGDKPLPFHPQPEEANPFLGLRGIRSFRDDPALLVDQLEAVCRAAQRYPVRVMFPMVTTVEEVNWALARLDEASGRLADGRPDDLQVGIMVEVPAAALRPEALSTMLDFVSIGSNDLTQYTLAAERGNPGLDSIADPADPAVLELIRATCDGVAEGVEVCVCGDAASDPGLALILVGLGVGELSATTASVPAVKDAVRQHSLVDLQDLAERALHCDSATAVRELLDGFRRAAPVAS
jgi:phosphocarrier protein FPr